MADIDLTLRREKLSHLTIDEVDANFVNLRQGIVAEEVARDVAIAGAVESLTEAISDEIDARTLADNILDNKVTVETNARIQSYNTLDGKINTEIATRTNDYYTKTDSDARYVNVSGDTITSGNLAFGVSPDGISNYGPIWSNNTDSAYIQFQSYGDGAQPDGTGKSNLVVALTDNGNEGFQISNLNGATWNTTFYVNPNMLTYKGNKIWHAGNDGAGSGLDADTLDGLQATAFYTKSEVYHKTESDNTFLKIRYITTEIGPYLDFHASSSTNDFDYRVEFYSGFPYGDPRMKFIRPAYFSNPAKNVLDIGFNSISAPAVEKAAYNGTDTEKFLVTKEYMQDFIQDYLLSESSAGGYYGTKNLGDGLILKWVRQQISTMYQEAHVISFDSAFPNNALHVQATIGHGNIIDGNMAIYVNTWTAANVKVIADSSNHAIPNGYIYILALGY